MRQSWAFFQNDFAGRIANRVMQTGPAVRETIVSSITAVWYIIVYGVTAIVLMAAADLWLITPVAGWFIGYIGLLIYFVPRLRDRSREMSEVRSALTGRVVDSYTNILTVKLFARPRDEDAYVRDAVDYHTGRYQAGNRADHRVRHAPGGAQRRAADRRGSISLVLWRYGKVEVGAIAMVLPLTFQLTSMSRWIAFSVTEIFEEVGVVQEGMLTIAQPLRLVDQAGAVPLSVRTGAINFENVNFHYGRQSGVLDGFTLKIEPGEKIGLIGRSGAGKSTVVNLLLRFFDLESGRIAIDGQDIARMTQESLRQQISMVTQDTSLLHRSIRDNIRYGTPDATDAQVIEAARLAHAEEFILNLEDWRYRHGYDAHVGERGVQALGRGQRQRHPCRLRA